MAALRAALGDVPLASTQPELSLLHQDAIDDGTLDEAMTHQLTPLAWSPLAGGRLAATDFATDNGSAMAESATDETDDGNVPQTLEHLLDSIAEREDVPRTAVALAWVMAHPSRPIPIVGTQRADRIRDAAQATRVQLSRTDWYALAAAAGRVLP